MMKIQTDDIWIIIRRDQYFPCPIIVCQLLTSRDGEEEQSYSMDTLNPKP